MFFASRVSPHLVDGRVSALSLVRGPLHMHEPSSRTNRYETTDCFTQFGPAGSRAVVDGYTLHSGAENHTDGETRTRRDTSALGARDLVARTLVGAGAT
jgi:hypothetical protein